MGRIFPEQSCRGIAGRLCRASEAVTGLGAVFTRGAKLPIGKLALALAWASAVLLVMVGSLSPAALAQPSALAQQAALAQRSGKIAAPGEPTLKAQKVDPASTKALKTRGKKRRKLQRLKKLPRITPEQQKAAAAKKTKQQREQDKAQQPFAETKLAMRFALSLAYAQVATTGERFSHATVEPGVQMELAFALSPVATGKGGGSALIGLQLINVNGATLYNDVFFRYSYNYFGPSLSYRYFASGERQPAAGDSRQALTWSGGIKGAVVMVQPNQLAQSNAKDEELEFKGNRAITMDAPGLFAELSLSYHLNNALALDLTGSTLLATEKTYSFVGFGVSGYL